MLQDSSIHSVHSVTFSERKHGEQVFSYANQPRAFTCRTTANSHPLQERGILALLCATAQQTFCRHAGVRRPSSSVLPSVVRRP